MKIYFQHKRENVCRNREASLLLAILGIFIAARLLKPQGWQNIQLPGGGTLPSLCLFHNITGYPDLGCGLTRSFVNIAHFHFLDAFRAHLLGPPLFIMLVVGLFYLAYHMLGGRRQLVIKFTNRDAKLAIIFASLTVLSAWATKIYFHLY